MKNKLNTLTPNLFNFSSLFKCSSIVLRICPRLISKSSFCDWLNRIIDGSPENSMYSLPCSAEISFTKPTASYAAIRFDFTYKSSPCLSFTSFFTSSEPVFTSISTVALIVLAVALILTNFK